MYKTIIIKTEKIGNFKITCEQINNTNEVEICLSVNKQIKEKIRAITKNNTILKIEKSSFLNIIKLRLLLDEKIDFLSILYNWQIVNNEITIPSDFDFDMVSEPVTEKPDDTWITIEDYLCCT